MTDDSRFGGSSGTPAGGNPADQDFGFFAGSAPVGAPSQFGPPPTPFAPAGQLGAPAVAGQQPYGPAPRGGLPAWAIVAICVPVTLVVLGILGAIAVPVFLSQRDKAVAASTTVSMPTQIAGMVPSTDNARRQELQGLFESLPACECFGRPVTSVYTDAGGTHTLIVGAAKVTGPFHADDREDFVRGFWDSVRVASGGAAVGEAQEQDPGKLGGTLSCAPLQGGMSGEICVAVDAGSFFFVFDTYQGGVIDRGLPTAAREAIVHRT